MCTYTKVVLKHTSSTTTNAAIHQASRQTSKLVSTHRQSVWKIALLFATTISPKAYSAENASTFLVQRNSTAVAPADTATASLGPLPPAAYPADGAPILLSQGNSLTAVPKAAGKPEASSGNSTPELGFTNSQNPNEKITNGRLGGPPEPISSVPKVGLFPGLGETFLNAGFDLHGAAFDQVLNNISTGSVTGRAENLLAITPNLDVDLGKLIGIAGGNIHASVVFLALRADQPDYANYAGGNLVGEQATPGLPGKGVELAELTYEQRFFSGKLSIEAGQTSVYRYFFLPNSLDPLTHYAPLDTINADFPDLPFPNWGGRATYKLTPRWYVQTGAFEDNFIGGTTYPGQFGDRNAAGAEILAEIGYRTEFTAAAPRNLEVGFEWNTRTGYSNIKGLPFLANQFDTATDYPGGGVIYAQGLQTLWHGKRAHGPFIPAPSINIYGQIDVAVDKPQPLDFDAMVGFNFTGYIPGRPFDATGIQVNYLRLSEIEANFETRNQDIFAGPGPSQPRDGYRFQVIQNVQVTNSFSVRPFVEYIVDPDNTGNSAIGRRPSSGFQVGLLTVLALGPFLGTSNKPF